MKVRKRLSNNVNVVRYLYFGLPETIHDVKA
jgi:hypothetical protein